MPAKADFAYVWLLIAAERELAAWQARSGDMSRVSPHVAGDRRAGEFHATLGAITAAAASIEAAYLSVLQRLRNAPGRDDRWSVPAVQRIAEQEGRVARKDRAVLTLQFDRVIAEGSPLVSEIGWLFRVRNALIHAEAEDETIIFDWISDSWTLPSLLNYPAEDAARAVDVAIRVAEAEGTDNLDHVKEARPRPPH